TSREEKCLITGCYCPQLATEVATYTRYLYSLIAKGNRSSEIFSNGAAPTCCRACEIYGLRDEQR
ncbi:MAG: hypothetical protein J6S57_02075, partial [Alphaproteobacteria bacterium]|nr:hypothetical protein [Alphaproteobacteria bacterium]